MYPGSVHDIEIGRQSLTLDFLSKTVDDFGGKILGDKGFIGLNDMVPTLTPQRINSSCRIEGLEEEIASKRILVENYFCRLKNQYLILPNLSKTPHDYIENLFFALAYYTNEHIKLLPLRRSSIDN